MGMSRQKKMVCHDCGTIFNRKPQNRDKQVCWNCRSLRVTLVTDNAPPPGIPKAPDPGGLKLPRSSGGGGSITPQMLQQQRDRLKAVVRPPVQLPGSANSPIPRGVRILASQVRNPVLNAAGIELEFPWRARGARQDAYAYLVFPQLDLGHPLRAISSGSMNPDHSNFNERYRNLSADLPTRKGPRSAGVLQGIGYFEYGWKRPIQANAQWHCYRDGRRVAYTQLENRDINAFARNLRQGKLFSERMVIAETGEVFYTPDHYGTFFRYHPGTMQWYPYRSAGGAGGPIWDESFYEPPGGR